VIRLLAVDPDLILDEQQTQRIMFWLLEVLPSRQCRVHRGPGIEIVVKDRDPDDPVPALQRQLEEAIGCSITHRS
jgi:hypothetical protein